MICSTCLYIHHLGPTENIIFNAGKETLLSYNRIILYLSLFIKTGVV